MPVPSTCKSCGAKILWCKSFATGRAAPINAEPDPQGNIAILPTGEYHVVGSEPTLEGIAHEEPRYTSHFSSCPHRERHRKG